MNTITVKTKKANFEVAVLGGKAFVSLGSIAAAKKIDVQDIEAELVDAHPIDTSKIAEVEGAKIKLKQLEKEVKTQSDLVLNIESMYLNLKKQLRREKDTQKKSELLSQSVHAKTKLDTAKDELSEFERQFNNLSLAIDEMPALDDSINVESLYSVLL